MVKINSLPVLFRGKDMEQKLEKVCGDNDVSLLALFGSFVHGQATRKSDVDLVVQFDHPTDKSLLDLIRTERQMGRVFKRKVDLVTLNSLSPYIKKDVLRTMRVIYERG